MSFIKVIIAMVLFDVFLNVEILISGSLYGSSIYIKPLFDVVTMYIVDVNQDLIFFYFLRSKTCKA